MKAWLARRALQAILTASVAVMLSFLLMRLAPGDPLARLSDERPLPPAQVESLRARYGLDQPPARQLLAFLGGTLRGDFGVSIQYGRPVTTILLERLPASLLLGGTVLFLTVWGGAWLGAVQAIRRGRWSDRAAGTVSLVAYAIPSFWLGLMLAWLFGVELRWLPAAGMRDPLLPDDVSGTVRWLDIARHLVLPALTLTVVSIGATMRYQRTAMLEALAQPYIQTARARGLSERRIRWRHAFRTALFPVVTLFGLWLPVLAAGSVFVEKVFAWPGLGSLAADAVSARDYPVIMGVTILVTILVVIGGLIADISYAALDPRVGDT